MLLYNQSLEEGGLIIPSELILVRIPVAEGDQLLEASTTVATGIPQPSQPQRRRPPQHHAFYISFSREGGAVNGYNAASEFVKRGLIPLPLFLPLSRPPPLFGTQFLIGGWVNLKDALLSVYPVRFELPRSSKFKKFSPQIVLSNDELIRIDTYRNRLPANTPLDPGGEQNRTANEVQDGNATDILSEDESTDEDCLPTIKDDLVLLAHSHPSWIPELEKYLEAERAEVQAEGTLRVESWLESLQGIVL